MPAEPPGGEAEPPAELLEESAEDLYENAPCGYLSTLSDGTIVKANQTFLSWTGHAREDLVGRRRFAELLTAGGRIYHETHLAPLLRMQGTVRGIALEIVRADGGRLPVLVNSQLKRAPDGTPRLIRTTVFDATDRKEYERELLRMRDRERAARERIERLQRITAAVSGAVTPEAIGAAIVDELVGSTGATRAVFAVTGEDGTLEPVTESGHTGKAFEARIAEAREATSPATAALRALEPAFEEAPAGFAMLPLTIGSRALGLIALEFDGARSFPDAERAFLVACAGQCAQALERAELHERTRDAAQESAFHAGVSRVLDEVQSLSERAQRLLDLLVRHAGGLAWIELHDEGTPEAVAAADRSGTPAAELLAAPRESRLSEHAAAAVEQAVASGHPRIIEEPETDGGSRMAAAHSYAALPLRARGNPLGVLVLARFEGDRRFRPTELRFLTELADRAGLALENALLYEQERDVARTLQHSLLAGTPPVDARFEVATHYRPAIETLDVGGDWYDTFATGEDRIAIVVGDVVGRGITAASAMGQLRSGVRALAAAGLAPAELLGRLDAFVAQVPAARWATLAIAEVDLATGHVRFACAGHPPPLLAEPESRPRFLWDGRSPPVGVRPGTVARTEGEVTLQPGSRLLLYTDGVVERRSTPLDVGLDRLLDEFDRRRGTPLPALADELTDAMLAGERRSDDVCLLCLAFRGS
jgi:serine/threonine-protein kinase RsbW